MMDSDVADRILDRLLTPVCEARSNFSSDHPTRPSYDHTEHYCCLDVGHNEPHECIDCGHTWSPVPDA